MPLARRCHSKSPDSTSAAHEPQLSSASRSTTRDRRLALVESGAAVVHHCPSVRDCGCFHAPRRRRSQHDQITPKPPHGRYLVLRSAQPRPRSGRVLDASVVGRILRPLEACALRRCRTDTLRRGGRRGRWRLHGHGLTRRGPAHGRLRSRAPGGRRLQLLPAAIEAARRLELVPAALARMATAAGPSRSAHAGTDTDPEPRIPARV
jgi:hypothetical protein